MRQKNAATGAKTGAALEEHLHQHLIQRLAVTKALVVDCNNLHLLAHEEAERIADRMRTRYPAAWRAC